MSYLDLTTMIDATSPAGRHYYEKSSSLKALSDEAIERIAHYGLTVTSPFTLVLVQHVHGAVCRIAPTEMAISALRDESYVISIVLSGPVRFGQPLNRLPPGASISTT
jgi:hypothetical protein